MKHIAQKAPMAFTISGKTATSAVKSATLIMISFFIFTQASAQQAVSGIITDYQGYWKSKTGAYNTVKPVNNHNLLAFTYNNTTYSTGVNDAALTSAGETFTPGDFWSLAMDNFAATLNSNSKVGVGEMYDGVHNGAGTVPSNDFKSYLSDGIKGLNIGTCIANLPSGDLTFFINNINPALIGDGIPDVLVTQVADPSGTFDRYSFIDNNGVVVGDQRDIVFTNISPVGNWTADFWEASKNPMTLGAGFTNTDRAIRLWAADLSEFGITAANYQRVRKFRIHLSGDSDVAFVAYNKKTISLTMVLPVSLSDFNAKTSGNSNMLSWKTSSESNSDYYIVEKKNSGGSFVAIDSVRASGNSNTVNQYNSIDKQISSGTSYYRIRMVDLDGKFEYSKVVTVTASAANSMQISIYPNPASGKVNITMPSAGGDHLDIFSVSGLRVHQITLSQTSAQASVNISNLNPGVYYIVWQSAGTKISKSFVVK